METFLIVNNTFIYYLLSVHHSLSQLLGYSQLVEMKKQFTDTIWYYFIKVKLSHPDNQFQAQITDRKTKLNLSMGKLVTLYDTYVHETLTVQKD